MRSSAEALLLTLFQFVPLSVWDAFWLVTDHNSDPYKSAFLGLYHLEIVTIVVDDVDTTVVRPDSGGLSFWVSAAAFVLSPGGACLAGCEQSKLPAP